MGFQTSPDPAQADCKCSFCEARSAFTFIDVATLNACRDHLLEAIEWVAA